MKKLIKNFILISLIFFIRNSIIYAKKTIFYKNMLTQDTAMYELDLDNLKIVTIKNIDNYSKHSNIVNSKFVYAKFDNIKSAYAFYLYNLKNNSRRFLFLFFQDKNVINTFLCADEKYILFTTTDFIDRPNTIKIYKHFLNTNEVSLLFKYQEKDTFNAVDNLNWLSNEKVIVKIYQEGKASQIILKAIKINAEKSLDVANVKTDYLKVFAVSENGRFIAYHPNNGNDKSIELSNMRIYDFKNEKDLPLLNKKIKKIPNSVISQVIWSENSQKLLYAEAQGKFDIKAGEFVLDTDNELKSIPINSSASETIIKSLPDYNIIEIWEEYKGKFICQIYDKKKDSYQLVLINKEGKIEKIFVKNRVARLWE